MMQALMTDGPLRDGLLLVAVGGGIGFVAWLICRAVESSILGHAAALLEQRHRRWLRVNYGFEQRLRKTLTEVERTDSDKKQKARDLFELRNRLRDLQREKGSFTRSFGEEESRNARAPTQLFIARMFNEVVQKTDPSQREALMLPADWAKLQRVEVWAADLNGARQVVERACPASLGYVIQTLDRAECATDAAIDPLKEAA
jgi:hypothetical protein